MREFSKILTEVRTTGNYQLLTESIPYAKTLGVEFDKYGDQLIFCMPANKSNVGNPLLPAIHGGVIAGFMELTGALQLMVFPDCVAIPKIIDFSIDYLRAGRLADTYAMCQVGRQGKRVANLRIEAWQANKSDPIAFARANFKLVYFDN